MTMPKYFIVFKIFIGNNALYITINLIDIEHEKCNKEPMEQA